MADNSSRKDADDNPEDITTNELADGSKAQFFQLGASDAASADDRVPASETDGLLVNLGTNNDVTSSVDVVRIAVVPTISTTAYAAKDNVGALMTFADAASSSGGSGRVVQVIVVDEAQQMSAMDLVFFRTSITTPTDNAAFDPTDAEVDDCIGTVLIPAAAYTDFTDNAVANVYCNVPFVLSATSLFGVLVARGAPTHVSTTGITVALIIERDA